MVCLWFPRQLGNCHWDRRMMEGIAQTDRQAVGTFALGCWKRKSSWCCPREEVGAREEAVWLICGPLGCSSAESISLHFWGKVHCTNRRVKVGLILFGKRPAKLFWVLSCRSTMANLTNQEKHLKWFRFLEEKSNKSISLMSFYKMSFAFFRD